MVSYLVALDGSENSKSAFYATITMMNHEKDKLYLLAIVENYTNLGVTDFTAVMLPDLHERAQKEAVVTLRKYSQACRAAKIFPILLTGGSSHVGELICQTAEKRGIDFIVLGRRGLGKLERLLVGSTSKYCVEHAKCSVIVIKGGWGPKEEHSNLNQVIKAEEEERKRRVEEYDSMHDHPVEKVLLHVDEDSKTK
eukprot:TRINITY_DN1177_c0_g1_i1.p1 TRINITY_DN1177_c0_g1~~TRINITY_DN1177_c0_g1_i1.p1  ORF type:complete len:196 (-),score=28.85 TRINITY_DN1177_c0_g1_i1:55-642(-)